MAVKKSDLYARLWASCDELRGGMDASLYKDYVLFMLFIKYVSDKYADSDDFEPPIVIPPGASFRDMVALKGKSDIGDRINTDVIQPLINANRSLLHRTDFPDFNDPNRLGEGKAMVDRLTNLVSIFQSIDLSGNRAEHDDILGDAYEYLMRHFATESGKSKGQFYTPSEVSRVMAQVIGIRPDNTVASTTAYDPTCGSGSLLLKVAAEAGKQITLEGQEKDVTTAGLARMNMILHDFPTANIRTGNTLAEPKFRDGEDGERLRTYDYVVANPPFSDKAWSNGLTPESDPFQRFAWGVPPAKQGDYAYLLHILRSLKSTGKGACILPHGVLFRGNAEAVIRRKLVESGVLKGIIGLPANLFYGTGIPAAIIVLDKENAAGRKGVFMVDASKGFLKDGNKNRLRERDIHRIADVFTNMEEHAGYSRLVFLEEISRNDYNLNLPRFIKSQEIEDIQDLNAHLYGGIPERDVESLKSYWKECPNLRIALFSDSRPGYQNLKIENIHLQKVIHDHPEFSKFVAEVYSRFEDWKCSTVEFLYKLEKGLHPKNVISRIAEDLLHCIEGQPLLDAYAVYQHLLDYWSVTMQDDLYAVSADGWIAKPSRAVELDKKGKSKDKGWTCDLLPKSFIISYYYIEHQNAIEKNQVELEIINANLIELEEEHSGEDDVFSGFDKINAGEVRDRLKEISNELDADSERVVLQRWLQLNKTQSELKKTVREAEDALEARALAHYDRLTEKELKTLIVEEKWLATLVQAIETELDCVAQTLTNRILVLTERYGTPLPQLSNDVALLTGLVEKHLQAIEGARH